MIEKIIKFDQKKEFYTSEKCYINELSNSADDTDVSIAMARVEPGVTTNWHRLVDTAERYTIISGRGRVEIGDLSAQEVSAGDVVIIPAQSRQRISNIDTVDLVFLAICTPRFSNEVYHDME